MEGAANVFIGIVLILSLVFLAGLILLRRRQRSKLVTQANPWGMDQPGQVENPTQTEKTGLLQRLTRPFGGGKTEQQFLPQDLGQPLPDLGDLPGATPDALPGATPDALPDAASATTAGEDDAGYSEAGVGDDTDELTRTEAEAFNIATDTTDVEDASSEDVTETEDRESADGGLDESLLGAFKTDTVVETSFTRLVQRVEPVEIQDLADEIHALTALFEKESPQS